MSRRECLNRLALGVGGIALADLLARDATAAPVSPSPSLPLTPPGPAALPGLPHFAAKAKCIIYLFQSGGPSQLDLYDYKPLLNARHGEQLPDSVRGSQRLTGMSGNQSSIPIAGSPFKFSRYGQSGAWISDLLPHTAKIADDLCVIRSMHTEAINHGPGVTFMQTGSQIPGRPSFGSWLDYGLGSANANLPSFVVLITKDKKGQPLMSHLWGAGFIPAKHQGVRFRSGADPVLYLNNPAGVSPENRRLALDRLRELHEHQFAGTPDAEISTRISNYEMAFNLQTSVPEVTDLSGEPAAVVDSYGPDARTPGSFAANCLLARRLAERGVKFIQLYHQDWDHHGGLPSGIKKECLQTDQPAAALIADLKQRGMLDETLVVWGGEFGRTNYSQGIMAANNFGRDHHPRCFSLWMAGGGVKPGITYGETDDYGYNVAKNPVHVHDLHATILHLFGVDHERLTYRFQGRRYRLTDVFGKVVNDILT
ncbi:MAG: sulfatase [Opitutia bacterium Tous-C4FEB]|nr:MAG: sulfatase [Opitutae bacterium Tous-C5TDCM]PAW90693.1 MAG: sulfatase [Opitutae bacterium Tous-C4FEB]